MYVFFKTTWKWVRSILSNSLFSHRMKVSLARTNCFIWTRKMTKKVSWHWTCVFSLEAKTCLCHSLVLDVVAVRHVASMTPAAIVGQLFIDPASSMYFEDIDKEKKLLPKSHFWGQLSPLPSVWRYCFFGKKKYLILLKTGLGILDFLHFDWLNGARLSAHIPAATKYGQWTLNNKVSWKFFPRERPGDKNGREKSFGSEFKSSRNSNSVTAKHHQQRRLTQVKIVWRYCAEIEN